MEFASEPSRIDDLQDLLGIADRGSLALAVGYRKNPFPLGGPGRLLEKSNRAIVGAVYDRPYSLRSQCQRAQRNAVAPEERGEVAIRKTRETPDLPA